MNLFAILFLFGGLFSIAGAAADWDWFMNHRKAQFFVSLFGRNGARVFYMLLGLVLACLGAAGLLGFIDMELRR